MRTYDAISASLTTANADQLQTIRIEIAQNKILTNRDKKSLIKANFIKAMSLGPMTMEVLQFLRIKIAIDGILSSQDKANFIVDNFVQVISISTDFDELSLYIAEILTFSGRILDHENRKDLVKKVIYKLIEIANTQANLDTLRETILLCNKSILDEEIKTYFISKNFSKAISIASLAELRALRERIVNFAKDKILNTEDEILNKYEKMLLIKQGFQRSINHTDITQEKLNEIYTEIASSILCKSSKEYFIREAFTKSIQLAKDEQDLASISAIIVINGFLGNWVKNDLKKICNDKLTALRAAQGEGHPAAGVVSDSAQVLNNFSVKVDSDTMKSSVHSTGLNNVQDVSNSAPGTGLNNVQSLGHPAAGVVSDSMKGLVYSKKLNRVVYGTVRKSGFAALQAGLATIREESFAIPQQMLELDNVQGSSHFTEEVDVNNTQDLCYSTKQVDANNTQDSGYSTKDNAQKSSHSTEEVGVNNTQDSGYFSTGSLNNTQQPGHFAKSNITLSNLQDILNHTTKI